MQLIAHFLALQLAALVALYGFYRLREHQQLAQLDTARATGSSAN